MHIHEGYIQSMFLLASILRSCGFLQHTFHVHNQSRRYFSYPEGLIRKYVVIFSLFVLSVLFSDSLNSGGEAKVPSAPSDGS